MANFNITINAQPNIPYDPTYDKIRQGDCLTGVTSVPIGIIKTQETPGIHFLLSDYVAANGWAELRISNINYTNESNFFMKYNSIALTPNVDPNVVLATIDVTSVSVNEAIALLFADYNNNNINKNESLAFDLEIQDTLGTSLGKVTVGIVLLYVECIPPAVKEKVVINSTTDVACYIEKVVTVKVPAESSRYVYKVTSDVYSTVTGGTLPSTITSDTQYTLRIDVSTVGSVSIYSKAQLFVKEKASSGTIVGSASVSRNHAGNIC